MMKINADVVGKLKRNTHIRNYTLDYLEIFTTGAKKLTHKEENPKNT